HRARPDRRSGGQPRGAPGRDRAALHPARLAECSAWSSGPHPARCRIARGETMDPTTLTYATRDGIARIVLHRPAQLNAISPELLAHLDRVCEAMEGDPAVRAATLTAAGRAFCAGADLRAVQATVGDPERWAAFMRLWHRVFDRIEALPVPVVAGVHGLAL